MTIGWFGRGLAAAICVANLGAAICNYATGVPNHHIAVIQLVAASVAAFVYGASK